MRALQLSSAFLAAISLFAQAQPAAPKAVEERVALAGDSRCRKEIKDYVEAMRFVRQSAGDQIGSRVAQGYVSEAALERLIAEQGPCSAAQLLRTKGAHR